MGGFKGKPNQEGVVEIGYEIIPNYRNQGLATEVAQGLIDYAFSYPQVQLVIAHTLAEKNASTKVLEKVGMFYQETINDPEDGMIWRWSLERTKYQNS